MARGKLERFSRTARRAGLVRLGLVCALTACGDLPECPPGAAFDDCEASPSMASLLPGMATAGAGGGSASAAANVSAGGNSSEQPAVTQRTPVSMPAPPSIPPAAAPVVDACADDPSKMAAGVCGCGVPDDDLDADGAIDCREACPDNAARIAPMGACGCSSLTDVAGCTALRSAVRNLYTFSGTGLSIVDSVGGRNGVLADALNTATPAALGRLQQNGRVTLEGAGSFVDLPDGLISTLTSATFEIWLAWRGGAPWARIFDFGNGTGATPALGQTYLFLTPSNSENTRLRVAYSLAGGGAAETLTEGSSALPIAMAQDRTLQHVAVVIDAAAGAMRLYANGAEVSTVQFTGALGQLRDVNNWLGRSNYGVDPALSASLIEFRIYGQALTAAQLGLSFRAGPGALG